MSAILANTIWGPLFVYCYDWPSVAFSTAAGVAAEFGVIWLYSRPLVSPAAALRRLAVANLASYGVGFVAMLFVPLRIHKDSLAETALAFAIAYMITVPVEFYILRPLLPNNRSLLFRAVTMANFVSYAILFTWYFMWFFGWIYLIEKLSE